MKVRLAFALVIGAILGGAGILVLRSLLETKSDPRKAIVTQSADGATRTWGVCDGACEGVAITRSGEIVFTGGADGRIRAWDVAAGMLKDEWDARCRAIHAIKIPFEDQPVAGLGTAGNLILWRQDGVFCREYSSHQPEIYMGEWSTYMPWLVLGGSNGVTLVETEGLQRQQNLLPDETVVAVGFTDDGRTAMSAHHDGTVRFWDIESGREIGRIANDDRLITAATCEPIGNCVLIADRKHLRIWDRAKKEILHELNNRGGTVSQATCTAEKSRFITSSEADDSIRVWDAADGKQIAMLTGVVRGPVALSAARETDVVAIGDRLGRVTVWRWGAAPQ